MLTLTVRGLSSATTEQSLEAMFAAHGRVHRLRLAKDLFSGKCKGFAELQMEGHEARAAIAALDGSAQDGGFLRVGLQSEERPRRGGRR